MSEKIVLGLDFGSDSVGTPAVNCRDGAKIASASSGYPRWSAGRYGASLTRQFGHRPFGHIESMTTSVCETIAALSDSQRQAITDIGAAIFAALAADAYSDVTAAQKLTLGPIGRACQSDARAVAHFERFFQRHQARAAQAEPLYVPGQKEA